MFRLSLTRYFFIIYCDNSVFSLFKVTFFKHFLRAYHPVSKKSINYEIILYLFNRLEFLKIHSYCTPWALQWPLYQRGNTSYAVSVRDLFAELLRLIYLSNSHSPLSLLSVLKWKQSWTIFIFSISLKFTVRQLSYTVS